MSPRSQTIDSNGAAAAVIDHWPVESPTAIGAAVSFQSVCHLYVRDQQADLCLDDVSLDITAGSFVTLVGPSGCGKTTMLNMVAGMVQPTAGQVCIGGVPVKEPRDDAAYMLARDALLPWRSARRNVELGLEVRGVPARERREIAAEWLTRLKLGDYVDAPIGQLSQGMRQRVAVARTLALSPRLVLMDEPFAALDAQTRQIAQTEFLGLWERERPTVILVTHDLDEAIHLSDRVILLSRRPGRVVVDVEIELPRPRNIERDKGDARFSRVHTHLWDRLSAEFHHDADASAEDEA